MANTYRQHPSPTGHLVDDTLVPVPAAMSADTVVWFALPVDGGEDQYWEGLAAEQVAQERWRLRAVPLFAYDLNYGDEVSVIPSAEGPLVAAAVLQDGGQHTFRVWLGDKSRTALPEVVTEFGRLSCLIEGYSERLLGLSCGPGQVQIVESALQRAEADGRFAYERGRQ